ncbi:HNH endonuclease [Exiguobacterium sp.]
MKEHVGKCKKNLTIHHRDRNQKNNRPETRSVVLDIIVLSR